MGAGLVLVCACCVREKRGPGRPVSSWWIAARLLLPHSASPSNRVEEEEEEEEENRAKLRGSCAPTGQGFLTRAKGDGNKIRAASAIMWITSSRTVLECQHSIEFPFFSLWETREDYRGTSEPLIESSRRTKRLGPHLYVDDLADYYLQDLMMLWTMRSSLFITCLFYVLFCSFSETDPEGGGRSKSKRVRTTFTEEQLHVLQANFLLDSNPDGQDLERIATQFNGPVEKGDSGVVPEHESAAQETPQHFKQFRLQ